MKSVLNKFRSDGSVDNLSDKRRLLGLDANDAKGFSLTPAEKEQLRDEIFKERGYNLEGEGGPARDGGDDEAGNENGSGDKDANLNGAELDEKSNTEKTVAVCDESGKNCKLKKGKAAVLKDLSTNTRLLTELNPSQKIDPGSRNVNSNAFQKNKEGVTLAKKVKLERGSWQVATLKDLLRPLMKQKGGELKFR
jgi:hypothetical protein